jgi:hypothetical protein
VICFGGYVGVSMDCADDGYVYFDLGAMFARLKQGGTVIDAYGYIGLTNAFMMQGYDWLNDRGLCLFCRV